MNKQAQVHAIQAEAQAEKYSAWDDFKMLVKFRLNVTVVMSSLLAYAIVAQSAFNIYAAAVLALGGFLVTGSANALNQVLEKDFDGLMTRTKNRPIPGGRMQVSKAVLLAGMMALVGITLLALFNPISALLGTTALVTYAFVYTPFKRFSPIAVWIGAIPGALPVLIGTTAFQGEITALALVLFAVQFFWQLPHFWAIGWMSYDDYKLAGYQLLPVKDQVRDNRIGLSAFIWSLPLILICLIPFVYGSVGIFTTLMILAINILYAMRGWNLYKLGDTASAKKLMYFSFAYLPLVLILFIIGQNGI